MVAPAPTRAWRGALVGSLLVALAAALWLWLLAPTYRPDTLHVDHLNDQAGYITTARWLADHGELRSHLIYPAYLENPRWRLYMPGHYVTLAAAFKLFGYGPLQVRLPGLVSFVVSAVCVFLIGRRLYGTASGGLAATLVIAFPPMLGYSFTAMSEPTVIAACLLAFCTWVHLSDRLRPLLAPLLVALPFLFRETGALVLVPMLGMVLLSRAPGRWREIGLTGAGSVLVCGALYAWQTATGRQSLPLSWIARGEINFADALPEPVSLSLGEWIAAFSKNFAENAGMILGRMRDDSSETLEPVFMFTVIAFAVLSIALGIARGRRDAFPVGAGMLGVLALLFILLVHKAYGHVAIRHVLFSFPFTAVAVASGVAGLLGFRGSKHVAESRWVRIGESPGLHFRERTLQDRPRPARAGPFLISILGLAVVLLGWWGARDVAREIVTEDQTLYTDRLEAIAHDDDKMLVSTSQHALDYVVKHYPVRWSFVPANIETLALLVSTYDVGTLILRKKDLGPVFSQLELEDLGFYKEEQFVTRFWIFQRRSEIFAEVDTAIDESPRDRATRFSEKEILAILEEGKEGVRLNELFKKYGINRRVFERWKIRYLDNEDPDEVDALREQIAEMRAMLDEQAASLLASHDFTQEEIQEILDEWAAGTEPPDLVLKYNVTQYLLYMWRSKYGRTGPGATLPSLLRLRRENVGLRARVAELEARVAKLEAGGR